MCRITRCISLLALCFHLECQAQLVKSFGIKAAYTTANQTTTFQYYGPEEYNRRSGLNAAIFVEWFNIPYVSVVTQAEYAQRGMRAIVFPSTEEAPWTNKTIDNRLDYFSVLPLLKVAIPLSVVRPYVLIGPRLDFLLGYTSELHYFDDRYHHFKKRTYGATLGLGAELMTNLPFVMLIEGRYNADLENAYDNTWMNVRSNAFDVWLGVAL